MKHATALVLAIWITGLSDTFAQTTSTPDDRPATPSAWGDTGLWAVPSAEILPSGRWSFSFARTEADFGQGFTDVSSWPLSVAAGAGGWAEIFGSWRVITRIDRDTVPLFFPADDNEPGGLVNEFPATRSGWSGNQLGDLLVGGKASLLSEARQQPMALAVRGTVKFPTADEDEGIGTGKTDWYLDAIAGKEMGRRFDLMGFAGMAWRGDPDNVDVSNGMRWGIGASFPSRARVRLNAEVYGEFEFDENVVALPETLIAEDGTEAPLLSSTEDPLNLSLGITFQGARGLLFDAGVVYAFNTNRGDFLGGSDDTGDSVGIQFRIGWHGGVRTYVPPPPPVAAAPAPAPPPAAAPANQMPAVTAICDPCSVMPGTQALIRASGQDPDGDSLQYQWSSPTGTVMNQTAATSTWMAPNTPGAVPVTVTASDGRGGMASATVMITVREAVGTSGTLQGVRFNDVYFDLDQDTLRPDAILVLGQVVVALRQDPTMRIQIEGHACDLGTPEYNLGLSERRADRVREYLLTQGFAPDRVTTVAYGEERPQNDNSSEALRRLNRRAVLNATTER